MPLLQSLATIPLALLLFWNEPFTFEFSSQTDEKGMAYAVINANQAVKGLTVTITGDDGTKVVKTLSLGAGKSKKIKWKQKGKQVHYDMNIKGGSTDTDFQFDTRKALAGGKPNLQMVASRDEIVEQHKIKYKTSFVISNYLFQVFNTNGDIITEKENNATEINIGETIPMSWNSPDEVFMVYFKAGDDVGRFAEDRRVPWAVTIPHTEVNFDSGKWDIKGTEEPKVDEAFSVLVHELDGLEQANNALGPNFKGKITASLYIVGYTDTVGSPADNQGLSMNRAKQIAAYFRDKGAWCSIYYQGMGERGLAVDTDDSVDEVRNRRALYLLMPDPSKPPGGGKIPGSWKKLTDARPRMLNELPALPESYLEFKRKQREERERKFGGGSSGGDVGSGDGDGDSTDEWGKPTGGGDGNGGGGGDQFVAPEPIEGDEAGTATGKGCSIGMSDDVTPVGMAALLALLGLRRRRAA